jgi:hypothetical protein
MAISALEMLSQKDGEFEDSLGYVSRPCIKKQKKPKQTKNMIWPLCMKHKVILHR